MDKLLRQAEQALAVSMGESAPIPGEVLLDAFSLNGESEAMKQQMLDDKFILGRLAILGQSTVFYARPNAGKTLLTLWLLIQAIEGGQVDPRDVYYINADDNHKGLTFKLLLAEQYGFSMLAPGYKGFKPELLARALTEMVNTDTARGKVVILDTLKKFADIMDKRLATKFGDRLRQFIAKGGSSICLAHVNKHPDADGNVVYSGTSDIVDDCDCAYTLQVIEEDPTVKVVEFTNIKNRGDTDRKALFSYSNESGLVYSALLNSIAELDESESGRIAARSAVRERVAKNQSIIDEIKAVIGSGVRGKTDLVAAVRNGTGESKKRVISVLSDHCGNDYRKGQFWTYHTGDNNLHIYTLNRPEAPEKQPGG